jgi:hypothetical protein
MDGHSLRRRRPNWCWPSHTYLACFLRVSRFFVSAARHAYVRTAWSDLGVEALRQQRNSRTRLGFRPSLWSTPDVPPDVYSVVLEPALCCASLCGQAFSVEDENQCTRRWRQLVCRCFCACALLAKRLRAACGPQTIKDPAICGRWRSTDVHTCDFRLPCCPAMTCLLALSQKQCIGPRTDQYRHLHLV